MAKSKEQKQAEALARKREQYVKVHLADFIDSSPISPNWKGRPEDMLRHIQWIANLRRWAKEADIQLTGDGGWCSMDAWPFKELVNELLVAGTIHHFIHDCNTNRIKAGSHALTVDPPESWGPRLKEIQLLLKHPKVIDLINFF